MATKQQRTLTYTITDVASMLRVDFAKAKRWVETGELESFNVGTHDRPQIRIRQSALDAFIERRQTQKPQLPARSVKPSRWERNRAKRKRKHGQTE